MENGEWSASARRKKKEEEGEWRIWIWREEDEILYRDKYPF